MPIWFHVGGGFRLPLALRQDAVYSLPRIRRVALVRSGLLRHFSQEFAGRVLVSSHGRVQHAHGLITSGSIRQDGYAVVSVAFDGARKAVLVHRLIAHTFLNPPPSPDYDYVNHRDGSKSNNHKDNLEFVTQSQNMLHAHQVSFKHGANVKPVLARRRGTETWIRYPSQQAAALELGVGCSSIRLCCAGKAQHVRQYEFALATPDLPHDLPGEVWRAALHPESGQVLESRFVSSCGRVKNIYGGTSWGTLSPNGYRKVGIFFSGKRFQVFVHRLVVRAFLGPPPVPDWQVNHKDLDRSNNNAENLEYVTRAANVRHSYKANPGRRTSAVVMSKPVLANKCGTGIWTRFCSASEAARVLGIRSDAISRCCHGKQKQAGNYEFKFASPAVTRILPGEEWREAALAGAVGMRKQE